MCRDWTAKVLASNLTYYRLRRELFEKFNNLVFDDHQMGSLVELSEEVYIVIRQFLTSRNDAINDDKRLSFDKAIFELRRLCSESSRVTTTASPSITGRSPASP